MRKAYRDSTRAGSDTSMNGRALPGRRRRSPGLRSPGTLIAALAFAIPFNDVRRFARPGANE
jgi:hypothetical protein